MSARGQEKLLIGVGSWSEIHMERYAGRAEVPLVRV